MDNRYKYKSLYLRVNYALFRDEHIRKLGANTIVIFMIIRTYANYDGIAYPSLATLSRKSGCGNRTVQGAIEKLVSYGWIEKEKRRTNEGKFSRNYYHIVETDLIRGSTEHSFDDLPLADSADGD